MRTKIRLEDRGWAAKLYRILEERARMRTRRLTARARVLADACEPVAMLTSNVMPLSIRVLASLLRTCMNREAGCLVRRDHA